MIHRFTNLGKGNFVVHPWLIYAFCVLIGCLHW
jgi:hypothetical protein